MSLESDLAAAVQRLDANPILFALGNGQISYAQALDFLARLNAKADASMTPDAARARADALLREQGYAPEAPASVTGTPTSTPPTAPLPPPPPRPTPLQQRSLAFQEQDPQTAFTRYLEQLQGGRPFSEPVRGAVASRGAILQRLAPFLGYGTPTEEGGAGSDFADFYQRSLGQTPSFADRRGLLGNITGALATPETAQSPQQQRYADLFGGLQNPYDFVADLLTAGSNPYIRGVLSSGLQRRFRTAEATQPEVPFLDYARQRGYF